MSMRRVLLLLLVTSLFASEIPHRANAPIERYDGVTVTLGSVALRDGTLLRTIITRPQGLAGLQPALLFVGWLSCDSMEAPSGADGFGQMIRRIVQRSGFITLRVDKPGVGDSQGNCARTDFNHELEAYRAGLEQLLATPGVDHKHIHLVGMSNGAGFLPLVAQATSIEGYVSLSGWGRTWYEHMLEHERLRLALSGKPPEEITSQMRQFATFYDEYLNQGRTPGEVLAAHPHLRAIWYDKDGGQYGRPAVFYQQLQALNLGAAWSQVSAPVLVVRGDQDFIMSHNDAAAIADAVNHSDPGSAIFLERPRMSHGFKLHESITGAFAGQPGSFDEQLADLVVRFLRQHSR
jgi:pimeloyl-ACP methyl ester carboxylesterase